MNCRNVLENLQARLDAPIGASQEAGLAQHLQACVECAQEARRIDLTSRWLRELPASEPSDNFEWRLKLRLSQATSEPADVLRPTGSRGWSLRFAGAAMAAALVVVVVGTSMFRQPGSAPAPVATGAMTGAPAADGPRTGHHGLPNLAVRPAYMRIVPTSSGAPLGPYPTHPPAPSILGTAVSDTAAVDD